MPRQVAGRSDEPNWRRYLRFWRADVARDIDEELHFHFEARANELRARGVPPAEIERIILDEFGDLEATRRRLREIGERIVRRRENWWLWHQLMSDLRYTVRGLVRAPSFATAVIATLALGIGANAAIFSVIDRMLFRPPPMMRAPSRAHRVYLHFPVPDGEQYLENVSYARYLDLSRWSRSFDQTALYSERDLMIGSGDDSREAPVGVVSASFFNFFDAPPVLGRYFAAQEDLPPNGTPVAVLSYGAWQTRYGGSTDVLGKPVQIGPGVYTVIGVSPRGFAGLWPERPPQVFLPFTAFVSAFNRTLPGRVIWSGYGPAYASMLVERKPGVSIGRANADLTSALLRSWQAQTGDPRTNKPPPGWFAVAAPILSERGPNRTTAARVAGLVGGTALLVLLIAAANVANLLMARALRRRREVAVRLALGASRRRLASQHLVESVVLAVLGSGVGLVAAQWAGSPLRGVILPAGASGPIMGDERTLIFIAISGVLVGLLSGLAAATVPRRTHFADFLKLGAHSGTVRRSRVRVTLLVLQAALSVLLLVGAGLFVRSLDNVRHVRLGYDVTPVLDIGVNMRGTRLDSAHAVELRARLLAAAQRAPGVEHAALNFNLPFEGRWLTGFWVRGVDSAALGRSNEFYLNAVSPDYFAVMGTRIIRGRGIESTDVAGAPGAIVLSSALANLLWPGKDPLGQCVKIETDGDCRWIVGVAEDIKNTRLSDDAGLYYYVAAAQYYPNAMQLVVRTRGDAANQAETVRRALQREMPGASYLTVTPFAQIIGEETHSWRLGATMFVAYGALALVLAAVGLYGVIAYDVEQRTHEIGLRVALGAAPRHVVWLVVKQGVWLAVVGLGIGGAATVLLSPTVSPLLFGVSPHDPLVYAVVTTTILVVAVVASLVPARHAAAVDPTVALAAE